MSFSPKQLSIMDIITIIEKKKNRIELDNRKFDLL